MSHVAEVQLEIKSLDDLEAACRRLGLEFVRGQQTYRCYFEHGTEEQVRSQAVEIFGQDSETINGLMPPGFTLGEMGRCQHAIRLPDDPCAYEIGVVPRRDGKPGYMLLFDGYGQRKMLEIVGDGCHRLRQAYAAAAGIRTARAQGFRVSEVQKADGSIQLVCQR